MRNNLDRETSPYLLQHSDNPVHWQAWGPDALTQAERDNKPILLSVGYAACHWCHVMAHESFEDPEIAALMNELFVNIKVDREERPDIDAIYQTALALTGQQGGWPLTMFLSADGKPFWGGTYFPPQERWGRPGFPAILRHIAEVYGSERAKVTQNTTALLEALNRLSEPATDAPDAALGPALLDRMADQLVDTVDLEHGGLKGAPKFPQPTTFALLWRAYVRTGEARYRDAVTLTLDRMCQGGIYDHLGGGFARYSTDPYWLVPHFEKMLYDNALLISLLTEACQDSGRPLYEQRIRETIAWAEREMVAEGGAFAGSFDADSEGEEGRFYVWTEAEIDALLGAEAEAFKEAYDVTPAGNWEGKTILNRSARPEFRGETEEAALAKARAILLRARAGRIPPAWDDKVLADWNGLMIVALAEAAAAFGEPAWLAAAIRAFDFVVSSMAEGDRLLHAHRGERARHAGVLDDYANMALAALALHEVTGEGRFLAHARDWVAAADAHFWDTERGAYYFTADDAEALIVRTRSAMDNATPSGNGTMTGVLAKLHHLTGEDRYRSRAEACVAAFAGEIARNFLPLATLVHGYELLTHAVQIIILGERGEAGCEALLAAAHGAAVPNRVLQVVPQGAALPLGHPAVEMTRREGRATAYVCFGPTCSLPLTAPEALSAALRPGSAAIAP